MRWGGREEEGGACTQQEYIWKVILRTHLLIQNNRINDLVTYTFGVLRILYLALSCEIQDVGKSGERAVYRKGIRGVIWRGEGGESSNRLLFV